MKMDIPDVPNHDHRDENGKFRFAWDILTNKRYPETKWITVFIRETNPKIADDEHTWNAVYYNSSIRLFRGCHNPDCKNSGVDLDSYIRSMIASQQTKQVFHDRCRGHVLSPVGRNIYRKCDHTFEVTILIDYNEGVIPSDASASSHSDASDGNPMSGETVFALQDDEQAMIEIVEAESYGTIHHSLSMKCQDDNTVFVEVSYDYMNEEESSGSFVTVPVRYLQEMFDWLKARGTLK